MTNSIYPAKLSKKLAHNLEHVADELVAYISEVDRVRDLVRNSSEAKSNYRGSWLLYILFYWITRGRGFEFDELIAKINQSGSSETLMTAFDQFLSKGGDITTSGALRLLTQLSLALPGYADTSKEFSLTESNLQDLRKMVLQRTQKILNPEDAPEETEEMRQQEALRKQQLEQAALELEKMQEEKRRAEADALLKLELMRKIELEKELHYLPRRNIKQAANELAESTRFLIKTNTVGKLDDKKFGPLKTELNGLYHNLLVKKGIIQPQAIPSRPSTEGAVMKNKPGKLKPEFLADMDKQLGGMLNSAATNYTQALVMEEKMEQMYGDIPTPATPPTSPSQPCAAAFEQPAVSAPITGEAKEMIFNDEQAAAMFSIFGSAQKVKVKPPKQLDPESKASPIASR